MATTAENLITRAYLAAQAIQGGESPTGAELTDGLSALNDLLTSWSEQGITVPFLTTDHFSLTPGQVEYDVGPALPGSATGQTQPVHIDSAYLLQADLSAAGSSPFDDHGPSYPFEIIRSKEYTRISQKAESGRPERGWYIYGEPNGKLVLDRDPTNVYTLVITSSKWLQRFDTLDEVVTLPPSYNRAIRFNLAVEIGGELGAPLDQRTIAIARESLRTLKNANLARQTNPLVVDSALTERTYYDIRQDY